MRVDFPHVTGVIMFIVLTVTAAIVLATENPSGQLRCASDAVFHESAGQPELGQELVFRSIQNRASDTHWEADTYCKVVHQPKQYSFTLWSYATQQQHKERYPDEYIKIESSVSQWENLPPPEKYQGVNHYLRCDVRDRVSWWKSMEFLGEIGDHCFYKGY